MNKKALCIAAVLAAVNVAPLSALAGLVAY